MRCAIVGAGGMGGAVAAFLLEGGHDVVLIGRNPEQAAFVRANGLRVDRPAMDPLAVRPEATAEPGTLPAGSIDMLLVLTKSFDTAAAAEASRGLLAPDGVAVTMQNGLGNERALAAAFGAERTLFGVTTIGGRLLGPGHIAITGLTACGESVTQVGPCAAGDAAFAKANDFAAAMSACGLPTDALRDARPAIWAKLAVAASGPLGSIVRRPVGELSRSEDGRALLRAMLLEVVAVAAAEGVALDADATWAHAARTWDGTGNYLNSMNVDVLHGRRTEIDAISGEVLRRGQQHGLAMPLHECAVRMVHLIETTYASAW